MSYWVDIALGQGELPRDPSLIHVNWMKWLGSRLNGHRDHDIQVVTVSHSWVPLYRVCGTFICNELFPSPLTAILLFFHNFKERLKVTALVW